MGNVRNREDSDLEVSVSIELEDADLLDIDGSDDATMMASSRRGLRSRTPSRGKKNAPATPRQQVVHIAHVPEDLRATNPIERQAEIYPDAPTQAWRHEPSIVISPSLTMKAAAKTVRKPQAPAHFFRPRDKREVSESYPPVAVMSAAQADVKLRSGAGSRWPWALTGVIATALLIVGSLRSVPHVDEATAAASQPPPAAEEAPKPADPANVVKFDNDDAVNIKRAAKPVAVAPIRHWTAPWKKPAPAPVKAAPTLGGDDRKEDKKAAAAPAADKKTAEQKELEELQLRAAAR